MSLRRLLLPSLADLVRVRKALGDRSVLDADVLHQAAALLGFQPVRPSRPTTPDTPTGSRTRPNPPSQNGDDSAPEEDSESADLTEPDVLPSVLEPLGRRPREVTLSTAYEQLPAATSEADEVVPVPLPLLDPRRTRGILAAAVSTPSHDGPIRIDALVDLITHALPVEQVPRRPRPSLRRGVQVLLDRGPSVSYFSSDQNWVLRRLERVVGTDRVQRLQFADAPLRGVGRGPRFSWSSYVPPPPGTPVLAVTDLGIGLPLYATDPASPREWLAFHALLQEASCPLIALVPYPPSRWPPTLRRTFPIVFWDRTTTAADVRTALLRYAEHLTS